MVPSRRRNPEKSVSTEWNGLDLLRTLGPSAIIVLLITSAVWLLAILGAIELISYFL